MEKKSSRGQNFLDAVKSGLHGRQLGKRARIASQGISVGVEDNGGMRKKTAVTIYEAEKTLEILEGGGKRILTDGINLICDSVAQKEERRLGKNTPGAIYQKAISLENVENHGQVIEVSGEIQTGHQNVIQIDENKRKTTEEMVHEPLKCLSSVAETERHLGELKEAERGDNGCLRDIGCGNRNLIVTFDQIEFEENSSTMETGREVMKIRERIAVRDSLKIEIAVVTARPP